jgi:hypothetical protein
VTVPAELVDAVRAADSQLPEVLPLLTASRQIAQDLHQHPGVVSAILRGQYTQECAA